MTAVFADTSYWIALTNVQDADHEKAEAFSASPILAPKFSERFQSLPDLKPEYPISVCYNRIWRN